MSGGTRLIATGTVGVVQSLHSWCIAHDDLWQYDEDVCDHAMFDDNDKACEGVPMYLGVPSDDDRLLASIA